jgi:hypothetical protein
MKQHMLPETAQMFAQCVHRVVARKDSYGPDIHRWLAENIEKTESGFRPWIRSDKEFKFMHERDAVAFALKWS